MNNEGFRRLMQKERERREALKAKEAEQNKEVSDQYPDEDIERIKEYEEQQEYFDEKLGKQEDTEDVITDRENGDNEQDKGIE